MRSDSFEMSESDDERVPLPGQWPVDPQEDVPISEDRIWVDGCFDFSHHGKCNHIMPIWQPQVLINVRQVMPEPCSRLVDSAKRYM